MAEMVIENGVVVKGIDEPHVIIPEGVTGIGFDAFARSKQLVSVQFPQTLTHIEEFAFIMCAALEELDLPDGITVLPALPDAWHSGAFRGLRAYGGFTHRHRQNSTP